METVLMEWINLSLDTIYYIPYLLKLILLVDEKYIENSFEWSQTVYRTSPTPFSTKTTTTNKNK